MGRSELTGRPNIIYVKRSKEKYNLFKGENNGAGYT